MTRAAGMGPLPELLEAQEGAGAVARVFAAEGLPMALIDERDYLMPLVSLAGLFERAARSTGNPVFGLEVGLSMAPGDYGAWVRHAAQAPSFGEATARLARGIVLHQRGGTIRVTPRPGGRIAWEYRHLALGGAALVQHPDHVVPVMIRFARGYLGPDWVPDWIEVGYPRPPEAAAREDATQAPWVFGASAVALVMPAAALSVRQPLREQAGADAARIRAAEVLAEIRLREAEGPSVQIGAVIALRLLDGQTDIDGAARLLGLGPRTLQRHLREEGLSYRALLDRIRMARARALIEQTDSPLTQIALDVGYSELAHFTRAFRRRFGRPPSAHRGAPAARSAAAHAAPEPASR